MKKKFKVGDRVKVVKLVTTDIDNTKLKVGMKGIIVHVHEFGDLVHVKFDDKFETVEY